MNRVNCKLFGAAYRRRRKTWLVSFVVHEQTIDQGWHAHALIGVPENSLLLKARPCEIPVPDLIIRTWTSMDRGRRSAKGQDAQAIYDFEGALGYVSKELIALGSFDQVDFLNTTTIPSVAVGPKGHDRRQSRRP
jgi:hypothetical protein